MFHYYYYAGSSKGVMKNAVIGCNCGKLKGKCTCKKTKEGLNLNCKAVNY
jgi:hypothetical protein